MKRPTSPAAPAKRRPKRPAPGAAKGAPKAAGTSGRKRSGTAPARPRGSEPEVGANKPRAPRTVPRGPGAGPGAVPTAARQPRKPRKPRRKAPEKVQPPAGALVGVRRVPPAFLGLLAGIQAALLSWICVMVPAVAAFTATAGAGSNQGVSWWDAARVGSDLWVLGHGGWCVIGSGEQAAVVSVMPLGVTLLSLFTCRFLARVSSAKHWPLLGGGLIGFGAVEALVIFLGSASAAASAVWSLGGGLIVAALGFLWGHESALKDLAPRLAAWAGRTLPASLRAVPGAAILAATLVLALAAVVAAVWIVGGRAREIWLFNELDPGIVGGVALALLMAAYAPDLVIWAVSYLSGTGFAVGAGTNYSVLETTTGPLPPFPLLGALPDSKPPALAIVLIAAPAICGVVAGWWLAKRAGDERWWQVAIASVGAGLLSAAALGGLVWAASGAIGPGRLSVTGGESLAVSAILALEIGLGVLAGSLLTPRLPSWWQALTSRAHGLAERKR